MYDQVMRSGDPEASPSGAPGLSGPAHDSDEALEGSEGESQLAEAQESETLAQIGTREVGEPVDQFSLREVDKRNGNASRARRQHEAEPRVVEAPDGSIHRTKAVSLVIPEEKRCQALTVRGERCRAGKMRGMEVCIFHAHRALSDDALATLADPEAKPRLSPRKALKAVVALRAEDLAEAAVGGALDSNGIAATRAVLALVDAVDPLEQQEQQITLSREGVGEMSLKQLRQVFSPSG
jgi:hypothetical protein